MVILRVKVFDRMVPLELTDQGVVTGDPFVVAEMLDAVRTAGLVGPAAGPYWEGEEILTHGTPFFLLAKRLFREVEALTELPDLPEVPEGAIT